MEYLKTDAELMQALLDGKKIDEIAGGGPADVLILIDGDICYLKNGEKTTLAKGSYKYAIHVEPNWYDDLSPDKSVLVRGNVSGHVYEVIGANGNMLNITGVHAINSHIDSLTPLTREEIQVFMDNAPEDV